MSRLDDLITELTSNRISRRQFMTRAAALGLSVPALQLLQSANVLALDGNKVRWVSPRARLEVFDDYPYWVAQHYGWFGDIETVIEGGPTSGSERLVAENQSDMAFPSPGVFTLNLEAEVPLVSVFQMGAYDVFDFAFRKGEGTEDLKTLEGKTVLLGDPSWQSIADPMFYAAGADISKISYVSAGYPTWGPALDAGQGDAALSWEGLRSQWTAEGLDFDYWLGLKNSKFPANSFVIRSSDFDDATTHETYTNYLKGWAMGLEFGHQNPRAAAQITYNAEPIKDGLQTSFPPDQVSNAVASMWELANVFRGDWPNRDGGKWGWHSPDSWTLWFDTVRATGALTKEFTADSKIKNEFITGANEFDHELVKTEATNFVLDEIFSAVPEPAGAGSEGAYPLPA